MRAGDMDRRVTIQRFELVDDGYSSVEVWSDLLTTWAEVRQETGREFFAAAAVQSERKVIFRMRFIESITVLDRVVYDGRNHNIHEVRELGRVEGMELHTSTSG